MGIFSEQSMVVSDGCRPIGPHRPRVGGEVILQYRRRGGFDRSRRAGHQPFGGRGGANDSSLGNSKLAQSRPPPRQARWGAARRSGGGVVHNQASTETSSAGGNAIWGSFVNLVATCRSLVLFAVALLLAATNLIATDAPASATSSVGMPVRMEQVVLPGSELEPVAVTDKTLVVIRIDAVYPHGTALRYDLVCYGLEPGEYDLRKYLQRKDGSSTDDLPALPFTVESRLAAGQIEPHGLSFASLPWLGGYRLLMILAGVVWVGGLIWLLFPRRKKSAAAASETILPPMSLADRLRPLVADAVAGRLAPARLAELERALVSYWRRRLSLESLTPVEALSQLRAHPEASPLVTQLETWLHRPAGDKNVDVTALLEPYRNIPPDVLVESQ